LIWGMCLVIIWMNVVICVCSFNRWNLIMSLWNLHELVRQGGGLSFLSRLLWLKGAYKLITMLLLCCCLCRGNAFECNWDTPQLAMGHKLNCHGFSGWAENRAAIRHARRPNILHTYLSTSWQTVRAKGGKWVVVKGGRW